MAWAIPDLKAGVPAKRCSGDHRRNGNKMKGVFALRTISDLFAKLEVDFERVRAKPADSYAAFDFCVTAWHLVDWKYPNPNDSARVAFLERLPILRICEHLAVGAKHFEPNPARHSSVTDTEIRGTWRAGAWAPDTWEAGTWFEAISVQLDGEAKAAFGDTITLLVLAEQVVVTWRAEL
jgi:hypothetical protein